MKLHTCGARRTLHVYVYITHYTNYHSNGTTDPFVCSLHEQPTDSTPVFVISWHPVERQPTTWHSQQVPPKALSWEILWNERGSEPSPTGLLPPCMHSAPFDRESTYVCTCINKIFDTEEAVVSCRYTYLETIVFLENQSWWANTQQKQTITDWFCYIFAHQDQFASCHNITRRLYDIKKLSVDFCASNPHWCNLVTQRSSFQHCGNTHTFVQVNT